MTSASPQAPLSADDYDALDTELNAMRERDVLTPDWEFCEGFLAALVCCRRDIAADEYWPVLMGEAFNPMGHMEFVWRWQRRWAEIATALDTDVDTLEDERTYQPQVLDLRGAALSLPEDQRVGVEVAQLPSFAQTWAEGFWYAVRSWSEEWAAPRDKEVAAMLEDALDAIVELGAPDEGEPVISMYAKDGPPSVSDQRLFQFGEAVWAVYDLRQLWKSLGPRIEPLRKEAAPGRNDPCPCGSGKKYKKCHGAG